VNVWNSLPTEVVTAPTVNFFKGRFDSHCIKNMFSSYCLRQIRRITTFQTVDQSTGNLPIRLKDDYDDDKIDHLNQISIKNTY